MTDTPKRLYGPTALTNSAATKYTVPAATTTIIRHILAANTTGGAVTFTLSIGADAAGTRLFPTVSIPANSVMEWTGFLVVATTEIVQAYAGSNSAITLTINGIEVS